MKAGKKFIPVIITIAVIVSMSVSSIFAKPNHDEREELGYGQGYWLPMYFYYAEGADYDGPAQNFNTATMIGNPDLKTEHSRLCGEIALAYILGISPEEALRGYSTLGEGNIFDNQGTIFNDMQDYAALFDYQAEFIYDLSTEADLHAFLLNSSEDTGILLPIRIHTSDGRLTFRSDQSQYQTGHWVVFRHLFEKDGQTWINVYNPYYNIYEEYSLTFLHSSWDFEVMVINPEGN